MVLSTRASKVVRMGLRGLIVTDGHQIRFSPVTATAPVVTATAPAVIVTNVAVSM